MITAARGSAVAATLEMPVSVSSKSSSRKCASAPARPVKAGAGWSAAGAVDSAAGAGCAATGDVGTASAIAKANRSATRRSGKAHIARFSGVYWGGGGQSAASLAWQDLASVSLAASASSAAALIGLGVVVATLLPDPVADQVLGALELLRPGVARDETRRLPHHVELAVRLHLADEHRLGDVVVRQHLRGTAGQVRRFDAGQRVDDLVGVGGLHLLDRLDPHGEADDVSLHRIVGHALRVLGEGLP